MAVLQQSMQTRQKLARFVIFSLIALLLAGVVGANIYRNLVYGRIDSGQPSTISEQPSFLHDLKGDSGTSLKEPMGIAVNKKGYIFVADTGNGRIHVYYPNGKFAWAFGDKKSGQ